MTPLFAHPDRAATPLLQAYPARIAKADGVWVRDVRGLPVLALGPWLAIGVLLAVPDEAIPALDMMWRGPGIEARTGEVTASLRRVPATFWCLPSLRHARMHGYRVPNFARDEAHG